MHAAVFAVLGVALGLGTFALLMGGSSFSQSPVCAAEGAACSDGADIVCVLRAFWTALTIPGYRHGLAAVAIVFNLAVPAMVHVSLELPLLVAGVFAGLMQVLGISVVFPLLFVPLHAFGMCLRRRGRGDEEEADGDADSQHTSAALLGAAVVSALTAGMFLVPGDVLMMDLFNFLPLPLFVAFWAVSKTGVVRLPRLMTTARAYDFVAGVAHVLYLLALGLWWSEDWDLGWADCHVAFLLLDAGALFLGVALHLWALSSSNGGGGGGGTGFRALPFLLHCVLLSPGAALANELRRQRCGGGARTNKIKGQ